MRDVITMVADGNYMDHARSILVNCRKQGGWEGEFCVISPESCDVSDFVSRGIDVFRVPDSEWTFMTKFWTFTEYFHKWDRALCIDLDIMVQGPLQKVFDGLGPRLPKILCSIEDTSTLDGFVVWDKQSGEGPDAHPEAYERLKQRYPHVTDRMYNAAFIFYEPRSMPTTTRDELLAVNEEFKILNPSNADQMIINLHLYDRLEEAGKDYYCFFGCDYPENQVYSEYRKWRGDEEPVLLHYTRWMAPWIVKHICHSPAPNTEPGGYRNHRLGVICHELYASNLAAFNETFPVIS